MSRALKLMSALLLAVLLLGCASSGGTRQVASGKALPAPDSTTAAGAYEGENDYRLGAQDLIEVSVFGVEDLSKTVRVNSNGQISLPLVGAVMAGGRTIPELEANWPGASRGSLQRPQVTVFVKEFSSQRINHGRAVKNPASIR